MTNKRKIIATTITILLFTATFGASTAIATGDTHAEHQHDGDGGKHDMSHGKCNMMSKVDSDNDGKISKEEFLKHHEAMFDKKDSNNDGFIDEDEMHKMMKKHMHGHGHDHGGHDHGKKEMGDKAHGDKQE